MTATIVKPLNLLARFTRSPSAASAVEFAIIFPVFVLLMLGGFEIVRYITVSRQLTYAANSMATMLAERTSAVNGNGVIFAFNSAMITFPQVLNDPARKNTNWYNYMSITLSSILFTPTVNGCTSGCTYKANVDWSIGTNGSRSCSVAPVSAPSTSTPSNTTLPQDVFTAGSIIVADVVYPFVPILALNFVPSITLRRSVYLQPRYLNKIPMANTGGPYGGCS